MPNPRITEIINALSFEKKLLSAGAALMIISLFLPWYQDIDTFRIGETFSGLNGPLYLIGYTLLALSGISIALIVSDYLNKKIPYFKFKPSTFHLGNGIASFYLLFVVNSAYFDHSFGVNIALKQSQFGMFMAFVSAALVTIGGYYSTRERRSALKHFEEETNEIVMPAMPKMVMPKIEQEKPKQNLRYVPVQTVHTNPHVRPVNAYSGNSFSAAKETTVPVLVPTQPQETIASSNVNYLSADEVQASIQPETPAPARVPQSIRMDL